MKEKAGQPANKLARLYARKLQRGSGMAGGIPSSRRRVTAGETRRKSLGWAKLKLEG